MPIAAYTDVPNCKLALLHGTAMFKDAGVTPAALGDGVQQWNDQSGAGNNATQPTSSKRPVKVSYGVQLTSSAQQHFLLPNSWSADTAGEIFILLAPLNDPGLSGNNNVLWHFGTALTPNEDIYTFTDGIIYDGWGSTVRKTTVNPTPLLNDQYHVYNVSSAAGAWTNRLDGSALFTTGTNVVAFNTAPSIGGWVSSVLFWTGWIAEVAAYSRVLTGTERTDVTNLMLATRTFIAGAEAVRASQLIQEVARRHLPGQVDVSQFLQEVASVANPQRASHKKARAYIIQ